MTDWQERVVAEQRELADRLSKLAAFLSRGAPGASNEDRVLLRRQRNAMLDYYDALQDRILRFEGWSAGEAE